MSLATEAAVAVDTLGKIAGSGAVFVSSFFSLVFHLSSSAHRKLPKEQMAAVGDSDHASDRLCFDDYPVVHLHWPRFAFDFLL